MQAMRFDEKRGDVVIGMPFPLFRRSVSGIAEYIVFGTMPSEMNPASRRPTTRLAFLLFHRWPCLPLKYRLGNHRFQE